MATAEEVATALAYEFLKRGNYSASKGPVEVPELAQVVAAGADVDIVEQYEEHPETFASLAVQSVGFEEGTEDPKVHIYLTRGSSKLIRSLPREIDGVPIRAHKMGNITVRPEAAAAATNRGYLFERQNRVCCGSSCAPASENISGTLGALVRTANSTEIYLLSNNHVFAGCNHVPRDQPILSPSSNDSHPMMRAPGEIGRHFRIHELRSGAPDFVVPCDADLALARATDLNIVSSWQGDDTNGYDTPVRVDQPQSMMRLKKFGRTTALTTGTVEARITTPVGVDYNSKYFKAKVWFKDVWTVKAPPTEAFALPGDSGSLVVSEDAGRTIGVVFACNKSGEYAWIVPMANAQGAFGGLTLVGKHGV